MSAQVFKDTYLFYFPDNDKTQAIRLEEFAEICNDLAGGNTIIYPARGTWIDPSGLKIEDRIAIVNVSGNFDSLDRATLIDEFQETLKDMGEHSGFYNRNGIGHMKAL